MEALLVCIPAFLITGGIWWFSGKVDAIELACSLGAAFLFTLATVELGRYSQVVDYEILTGAITSKTRDQVPCRHSYPCRCRTTKVGKTSTTHCDTCYEHFYDVDWNLRSNVGSVTVPGVSRQGLVQPDRWTRAVIGEPFSTWTSYTNYIKGVPESLVNFGRVGDPLKAPLDYPGKIYDLHRIDRVLFDKRLPISNQTKRYWNDRLSWILSRISPKTKMNAIVLITAEKASTWTWDLKASWLGGKINDSVLIIGTTDGVKIDWVETFSWSKEKMFDVALRDSVRDVNELKPEEILGVLEWAATKYFVGTKVADLDYLKDEVDPPLWVIILAIVLSSGISIGLGIYFHQNDPFEGV